MGYRKRGMTGLVLLAWIYENCLEDSSGCLLWQGNRNHKGYGTMKYMGATWRVHRLTAYLSGKGLPTGEWDHTCEKTNCVNPSCLEDVTHAENVRRGNLKNVSKERYKDTTHCPHGHPYSGPNLYVAPKGDRRCRECARLAKQRERGL